MKIKAARQELGVDRGSKNAAASIRGIGAAVNKVV
jgi:hypothetical protein